MIKFANPFRRSRPLSPQKGDKAQVQETSLREAYRTRSPEQFQQRTLEAPYALSPSGISNELQRIQTHVHVTSARIRHLQELVQQDEAAIARVTELIRRLRETHRDLEIFQSQIERQLGEDAAELVGDVGRRVWQAHQRLVNAEDRILRNEKDKEPKKPEEYMMTGALPIEDKDGDVPMRDPSSDTMDLDSFPQVTAQAIHSRFKSTSSSSDPFPGSYSPAYIPRARAPSSPEPFPRPRNEVIQRLQHEEANTALHILRATIPRQGSADGFTITHMVMSGAIDHRFVLPYFHHIKHHEVRTLKQWLAERKYITKSGSISRIEKLLHGIQLLQTGNRYESIAVVFSRSPKQIADSCREVMAGLLELYDATVAHGGVNGTEAEVAVYVRLWGIAKRFEMNQGADEYFGFGWDAVQRVLIALNLYIGRWRGSGSPWEGRVFMWGRYLGGEEEVFEELESYRGSSDGNVDDGDAAHYRSGGLHAVFEDMAEHGENSNGKSSDTRDDSSSPYEEPVIQTIPRPA
jgi:hypothetical protein